MKGGVLFRIIAKQPWIFCLLLPVVFVVLTAVGFTREDYVEDSVGHIWIPRSDKLVENEDYMKDVGVDEWGASSFAAMALSRDGGNLFSESRLEEIRMRMDAVEALTIEHNEQNFTWQDVCASNSLGAGTKTTYKWPCARLSPMDLFQETRTYFDTVDRLTWYHGVIKGAAIRPRILRFGAMSQFCLPTEEAPDQLACAHRAGLRTNPDYAESNGYQRDYANPLGLIGDVGSMELNDPCRICIEEGLEDGLDQLQNQLIVPFFQVLALEFQRYLSTVADPEEQAMVGDLAAKAAKLAQDVAGDRKAVEDFYYYQVIRSTYAELGAPSYMQLYNDVLIPNLPLDCENSPCPPLNVSLAEAKQTLLNHADTTFSSVTTAGSPLPFWDESDGTGTLLAGSSPVGGSGIDMSADIRSGAFYLDLPNYGNPEAWSPVYTAAGYANPSDPTFQAVVGVNPVYAWFMAAETEMTASCGNGTLTGSSTGDGLTDGVTGVMASRMTQYWCTPFNVPFEEDATFSKQHFARMWFDLLLDSDSFLGLTQGEDDPYSFTLGSGCGYSLGGERDPYTGKAEVDILGNASRELYFVDEGNSVGALDRHLLIGDVTPSVDDYSKENPLRKVGVIQSLFAALGTTAGIVQRVQNCNRPGGPVNITEDDAHDILKKIKIEFDDVWSKGWNDKNDGEVQFVSFSDDVGSVGTTGVFLQEITLSNGTLTAISILIIAAFSVFLMFSLDPVQSKVGVTLVGVALVLLSYFAALGFSICLGIKLNVATAWTLPFVLLGLGVDDMYIVLMALKKEGGYTEDHFVRGMKEVVVPVTMTSLVNASMFAIMNISDVPAVFLTARVALIAVCFLYLSIIMCFSAFCLLDMRRQEAGKKDVLCCSIAEEKDEEDAGNKCVGTWLSRILYDGVFRPFILDVSPMEKLLSHGLLWTIGGLMIGLAIWGITEREVGLGLEDFFPADHQAQRWASKRTESLSSWSIGINWGQLNYSDPDTQMKMIKQFEGVVGHPNVAEVDTSQLWLAKLNIWTTRQCDANVARPIPEMLRCGRDQVWPVDNTTCSGTWMRNVHELREKQFDDGKGECQPHEEGICRPTSQMHPDDLSELEVDSEEDQVWCPVFEGWSNEKMEFCIQQWRFLTGGGGGLILEDEHGSPTGCEGEYFNNEKVQVPIVYSTGPTMFAFDLFSHEITTEVIEETRAVCDYNEELHCWLTGIPYNYWSQYVGIFDVLLEIAGSSVLVGFAVALLFLLAQLGSERNHSLVQIMGGSLVGALLITAAMVLSLVAVIGLSILAGVNITGFSIMSFVLSVGFVVEYAVHIVSRWLHAPLTLEKPADRVHYAMSFLMLPTFMSFISSTIGVACLAFTEFEFTQVFYFRPLIIVMFVTYYIGCWWLPAFLTLLDFEFLKLGSESDHDLVAESTNKVVQPEATQSQTVNKPPSSQDISDHSC